MRNCRDHKPKGIDSDIMLPAPPDEPQLPPAATPTPRRSEHPAASTRMDRRRIRTMPKSYHETAGWHRLM